MCEYSKKKKKKKKFFCIYILEKNKCNKCVYKTENKSGEQP